MFNNKSMAVFALLILLFCVTSSNAQSSSRDNSGNLLTVSRVDVLERVFSDKFPAEPIEDQIIHMPRGGRAGFQFAIKSTIPGLLKAKVQSIIDEKGQPFQGDCKVSYVKAVPVETNTVAGGGEVGVKPPAAYKPYLIAEAPFEIAEVITGDSFFSVEPEKVYSVLFDVWTDTETRPGVYAAKVQFQLGNSRISKSFSFEVHNVKLPQKSSLESVHWISARPQDLTTKRPAPQWWSQEHWRLLANSFDVLRDYLCDTRVAVHLVDVESAVKVYRNADGSFEFDYTNFDRWFKLALDKGFETIESFPVGSNWPLVSHPIYYTDKVSCEKKSLIDGNIRSKVESFQKGLNTNALHIGWKKFAGTKEYQKEKKEWLDFFEIYFADLYKHLKAKGWEKNFRIATIDEPRLPNEYASFSKICRRVMPGIPISSAIHAYAIKKPEKFSPFVDYWQTTLNFAENNKKLFKERKAKGLHNGLYTMTTPRPPYPNRHLDRPLADNRLIPWLAYKLNCDLYLNWAANRFRDQDVYKYSIGPKGNTGGKVLVKGHPPGDPWQCYPGQTGLLPSMRVIAWRSGIEDYDLLTMLEKKSPEKTQQLVNTIAKTCRDYNKTPTAYHQIRLQLLLELEK